jgi:hypothetical protein
VTAEDLARLGFSRALWIPSRECFYLCPDGLRVVPEEEALREAAELVENDEGDRRG